MVGRRGSKCEILASLRLGEIINEESEVVWDREDTGATGGKRMATQTPYRWGNQEEGQLGVRLRIQHSNFWWSGLEHTPRQGRRERAWCRGKQRTNKHSEGRERRGQRPISRKDWGGSGRR